MGDETPTGIASVIVEADDAATAGVDPESSGSHRLVVVGDLDAFVDPDGYLTPP